MDLAQGRSIKFVRPTDECEGVDFDIQRFKPVRENVLWSMVILCSHGSAIVGQALEPAARTLKEIVRGDENVICVGFRHGCPEPPGPFVSPGGNGRRSAGGGLGAPGEGAGAVLGSPGALRPPARIASSGGPVAR